jgi:hypothetical protein
MKIVLDCFTPTKLKVNGTKLPTTLKVNGTNLPSDLVVKELIPTELSEELHKLLDAEREIIAARQAVLAKIRTKFDVALQSIGEKGLESLLQLKYPEVFL